MKLSISDLVAPSVDGAYTVGGDGSSAEEASTVEDNELSSSDNDGVVAGMVGTASSCPGAIPCGCPAEWDGPLGEVGRSRAARMPNIKISMGISMTWGCRSAKIKLQKGNSLI